MSAIDKLVHMALGNMLKDLPPEVQQHLTPEGMKSLGERVGKTLDFFVSTQMIQVQQNQAVLANQKILMEAQGVGEQFNTGPSIVGGGNSDSGGTSDAHASVGDARAA